MKIHEYNEMMAYLTRPGKKQGGVIGKPGGLVEPGVKYYAEARYADPRSGIEVGDELGKGIQRICKNFRRSNKSKRNTFKKSRWFKTYCSSN